MTVVVGVDNSAASKAALRLAAQEARWRQAPLVAERVIIGTARQTHAQLVVLVPDRASQRCPEQSANTVLLKAWCPVTIVPGEGSGEEASGNS